MSKDFAVSANDVIAGVGLLHQGAPEVSFDRDLTELPRANSFLTSVVSH
jgi:hypothetical protein